MTTVKTNVVIEKRYLVQFEDLCNKLSPENLTCDGELSTPESMRRFRKLSKNWKRLEKKVGRSVSEQEILELVYPHVYSNGSSLADLLASQIMRGE